VAENKQTYSKIEIEIADYILSNLDKNREAVLSHFVAFCRKNRRTIERYYKKAIEYNKSRQIKEEKVRDEVLIESTRDVVESVIKSKDHYLAELEKDFERLGGITSGAVFKSIDKKTGVVIGYSQSGFNDEISAKRARVVIFEKLSEVQGWNAPIKVAETDSEGNDKVTEMSITFNN